MGKNLICIVWSFSSPLVPVRNAQIVQNWPNLQIFQSVPFQRKRNYKKYMKHNNHQKFERVQQIKLQQI